MTVDCECRPAGRGARKAEIGGGVIIACLLATTACSTPTSLAPGQNPQAECRRTLESVPLEPGVGFGGLRIGMERRVVERLIGPPERRTGDASEYLTCGFALIFGSDDRLAVLQGGGHPTLNDRFTVRSAEGLGLGSSHQEILRVLGEPDATSSQGLMLHYLAEGVVWTLTEGRATHVSIRRPRPEPDDGD